MIKIDSVVLDAETEKIVVNFTYDLLDGTVEKSSIAVSPLTTRDAVERMVKAAVFKRRVEVNFQDVKQLENSEIESVASI